MKYNIGDRVKFQAMFMCGVGLIVSKSSNYDDIWRNITRYVILHKNTRKVIREEEIIRKV